jgi:cytochrome b
MLNIKITSKQSLVGLTLSSFLVALLADSSKAGPLTSSKKAFDEQMKTIEGSGGSGMAAISAPIFALIVVMIIIFVIITLAMAAFEGGGNLPMAERVKNVLLPAAFITVSLGIVGGLVTWIATI